VQRSAAIDFQVTVQSNGGNAVSGFSYSVSTWGIAGFAGATELTAGIATVSASPDGRIVRFKVSFPNAGAALAQTTENYIKCFARNDAGADAVPAVFRIQVQGDDAPEVHFLGPDAKGGNASVQPFVKVLFGGPGTIDASSIRVTMTDLDNLQSYTVTPPESSYDAAGRTLSYRYDGSALTPGRSYRCSVSVSDNNAKSGTGSVTFTVAAGAIADFIPYPSPFDPAVQPVTIRYVLISRSDVTLNVYDRSGRLVRNLVNNQSREPGISEELWDGRNFAGDRLANGVYFCEVVAKDAGGEHRRHTALALFGK
jgi:hypothetical protein